VIDVRVGEHHRIDGFRIDRQALVALEGLAPAALEHPAVEEDRRATGPDEVHGACDGLGGADELDVHRGRRLHQGAAEGGGMCSPPPPRVALFFR
jgi:hypothetical protein